MKKILLALALLLIPSIASPSFKPEIPGLDYYESNSGISSESVTSENQVSIIGFGDSIIAQNHNGAGTDITRINAGIINQAVFLSGDRFLWDNSTNKGVSGNTTTQMAARLSDLTAAAAVYPNARHVVIFMGGVNDAILGDPTGENRTTVANNYTTIFDFILKKGWDLIIIPEGPIDTSLAANPAQMISDIKYNNTTQQTYCSAHTNCYFLDAYPIMGGGADTPLAGYTVEGLHPNTLGADAIASQLLYPQLNTLYGSATWDYGPTNLINNIHLLGSGGTNSTTLTTVTGSIPDGMVVEGPSAATATITFSTNSDGSKRIKFDTTSVGSTQEFTLTMPINGTYNSSDIFQAKADMVVSAASNCRAAGIRLLDDATTDASSSAQTDLAGYGIVQSELTRRILSTDRKTPAAGNTTFKFQIKAYLQASSVGSCTIDIYNVGLFAIDYQTPTLGNVLVGDGKKFQSVAGPTTNQVWYTDATTKKPVGNAGFVFNPSGGTLTVTQLANPTTTYTISTIGELLFAGVLNQLDGGFFLVEDAGTFNPYVWGWGSARALGNRLNISNGSVDWTDVTPVRTFSIYPLVGDIELPISGSGIKMSSNTSGKVLVANGTKFLPVAMSGDVAISSAGATTVQPDSVAMCTDTTGSYVQSVIEGTGIDLATGFSLCGDGADQTISFDSTEIEGTTWGGGSNASFTWTINLSGTDDTIAFGSALISVNSLLRSSNLGTAAAPTYSWTQGNLDNGMFLTAGDTPAFASAGSEVLSLTTSRFGLYGQGNLGITQDRNVTAATAGKNLTITSGGAVSGGTNLAGGDHIVASGIATGNGESKITFQTVDGNQGTGTTDRNPANVAQFDEGVLEYMGTIPTISSCGTSPSLSAESTDSGGKATVGTSVGVDNTCLVTFAHTHTNAPACWCGNESQIILCQAVSTTTTVSLNVATTYGDGNVIPWGCVFSE